MSVAAFGDQPSNEVPAASNEDGEFADFASFQASSLPSLALQSISVSHSLPKIEATDVTLAETYAVTSHQPAFSHSLSVCDNSSLGLSSTGVSDKYHMIKEMISNPSLFTSGPLPLASELSENGNSEWSDFQGLSMTNIHSGVHSSSDASFHLSSSPDDGEWADFHGISDTVVSQTVHAVHTFHNTVPSSLPDFDVDRTAVVTKSCSVADSSNTTSWFGIQQNNAVYGKPSHALFSSRALDFSPPELPPENDDDDTNYHCFGDGSKGISSLSNWDPEDEATDHVQSGGGFMKSLTTSNSASSFEFTGWRQGLKHNLSVPSGDNQSASSLDLQPTLYTLNSSPNRSPSRPMAEADSQSESSLEFFPPSETRLPISGAIRADLDAASLQSLELKPTIVSPEEEPSSGIGVDDTTLAGCHSMMSADSGQENSSMPTSFLRLSYDNGAFSALTLLVGWQEGHPSFKQWWDSGVVICMGRGTDLHMAQLMPLPLTISCFSKSRLGLPFWYWLTQVVPDKIQGP